MKVRFSKHALVQMEERGAVRSEVVKALQEGEEIPAKAGRKCYRMNFQYNGSWMGKRYRIKQVAPVVVEEDGKFVVVTVYVFYF